MKEDMNILLNIRIKFLKNKKDIKENGLADYIIAGVALYLARGWKVTPIFPRKLGTHHRGFEFPKKYQKDFLMDYAKLLIMQV